MVSAHPLSSGCSDATLRVWTLNSSLVGTARPERSEEPRRYTLNSKLGAAVPLNFNAVAASQPFLRVICEQALLPGHSG